jgi:hypothetical protein
MDPRDKMNSSGNRPHLRIATNRVESDPSPTMSSTPHPGFTSPRPAYIFIIP